jgi:class 3 adenylate cyclase/tetratricopeptide (TPR) repeat protein
MHCAACLAECAEQARFCAACGAELARPVPGGERRKVVTVLFCDITGSTALGEAMDVESLRALLLRYFSTVRACLERHGGTVEKFIGDAVVAVFGVPLAHEDDALRAVRAALDVRTELDLLNAALTTEVGVALTVRIGINTGEVVASAVPTAGQALVSGGTVNLAARLQQAAAPGETLLGLPTHALVEHAASTEPVPRLRVKGRAAPLPCRRLVGLRAAPAQPVRYPAVPLLGRHRELATLRLLLDAVTEDRVCHLGTVYGTAGIGKSRLVHEFLQHARGTGARVGVGRCEPYGAAPLAPLGDALAEVTQAGAGVPAAAVEAAAPLLDGMRRTGYAGVDLDELAAALRRLIEALARDQPLVGALDNLQWAHPSLLDIVDRLAGTVCAVPVLLIAASRDELLEHRPDWGGGKLNASSTELAPLGLATCQELAGTLAEVTAHRLVPAGGDGTGAPAPADRVAAAAAGNPLFVEQLVAMGADDLAAVFPPTVWALLAARLDRLPDAERSLLEWAAVLGDRLGAGVLAEVAGIAAAADHLDGLVRRRFLEPGRAGGADRPAAGYRFVSPMMRDVVYAGLPKRLAAARHEQVAQWLAGAEPDRDDLVGFHLGQAVDLLGRLGPLGPAGSALAARAADHLGRAGRAALSAADLVRAGDLVERALELEPGGRDADRPRPAGQPGPAAGADPPVERTAARLDLLLSRAEVLVATGRTGAAEQALTEVARRAGPAGRPVAAAQARLQLAALAADRTGPERLAEVARSTLPTFEAAGDELGVARSWLRLAQASQARGQYGAAVTGYERASPPALRAGARLEQATILGNLAMALWLGPVPAGAAAGRCRQMLGLPAGDRPAVRVAVECPLAALLAARREPAAARAILLSAESTVTELGHAYAQATVPLFRGTVELLAGDLAAAEHELSRSQRAFERIGDQGMLDWVAVELARVAVTAGRFGTARRLVEARPALRGLAAGGSPSGPQSVLAQSVLARCAAADGVVSVAGRLIGSAVLAAGRTDSPVIRATVQLDEAWVSGAAGRTEQAGRTAGAARESYAAKGHLVGAGWVDSFLAARSGR